MTYDNSTLSRIARGVFMYEVLGAKRSDLNLILADFADILAVIHADKPGGIDDETVGDMADTLFAEATRATGQHFDKAVIRNSVVPMLRRHGSPTPAARKILNLVMDNLDTVPL